MKVTAFRVFYLVLILSIWQLITSLHIVNELVIPTPLSVGESLYTFFSGTTTIPDFYTSLIVTGIELATAYVIVAIMGVLIGMAFGLFRIIWRSFNPLLFAFFSIPMVVLYPVMFLVFGLGIWSKITFGILLGILPVIVNTSAG
ncbi:MAG: hypothetical protein M1587_00570 [Thaumarchaeota archaeon]|nr:hypothetical protein [Nitrososphaerota archaeon]